MSPIALRTLSAVVLAPVTLLAVYAGDMWFQGLVLVCVALGLLEWVRMCRAGEVSTPGRLLWLVAGGVYIGTSCAALVLIREHGDYGRNMVFFVMAVVWSADTGAYLAGSTIGGPKLAPRISPKKTWAGFVGALIASGLAGLLFFGVFDDRKLINLGLFAVVLGGIAQIGDLAESLAKRHFGVKDSGTIIPGHGGILDRIDGLMASSLFAAIATGIMIDGIPPWF